jgi:hypothetical protein
MRFVWQERIAARCKTYTARLQEFRSFITHTVIRHIAHREVGQLPRRFVATGKWYGTCEPRHAAPLASLAIFVRHHA